MKGTGAFFSSENDQQPILAIEQQDNTDQTRQANNSSTFFVTL